MDFITALKSNRLLFDGSFGAYIMSLGVDTQDCIMRMNADAPQAPAQVHRAYMLSGAGVASANTFIGNAISLKKHGIDEKTAYDLNVRAVRIARQATQGACFVGLDMGPCGGLMAPLGDLTVRGIYDSFALQARAAKDAGADFVIVETMTDLAEARLAALAAIELSGLPVVTSLSFEHCRLLTGGTPEAAAQVLSSIGVSAVGINCSGGPDEILPALVRLRAATDLPIVVQPNAGVPRVENGKTVFPLGAQDMLPKMRKIVDAGANAIGGCCGTRPEYIALFKTLLENRAPFEPAGTEKKMAATGRDVFDVESLDQPCVLEGGLDGLYDADPDAGYAVMNLDDMDLDEIEEYIMEAQQLLKTPVCIDCADDEKRRFALKCYCGVALTHGAPYYGAIRI